MEAVCAKCQSKLTSHTMNGVLMVMPCKKCESKVQDIAYNEGKLSGLKLATRIRVNEKQVNIISQAMGH